VRTGNPARSSGDVPRPAGDGVPGWLGKTDDAARQSAKDESAAQAAKLAPVGSEAVSDGVGRPDALIDTSSNRDAEHAKGGGIGKRKSTERRAASGEVDDPTPDASDVRESKTPVAPRKNGPKPIDRKAPERGRILQSATKSDLNPPPPPFRRAQRRHQQATGAYLRLRRR
jgi:hypothetical protein